MDTAALCWAKSVAVVHGSKPRVKPQGRSCGLWAAGRSALRRLEAGRGLSGGTECSTGFRYVQGQLSKVANCSQGVSKGGCCIISVVKVTRDPILDS